MRFGKIGGEVITHISVRPLTVGVNPDCVKMNPQLCQAVGTLYVMQTTAQWALQENFLKKCANN